MKVYKASRHNTPTLDALDSAPPVGVAVGWWSNLSSPLPLIPACQL